MAVLELCFIPTSGLPQTVQTDTQHTSQLLGNTPTVVGCYSSMISAFPILPGTQIWNSTHFWERHILVPVGPALQEHPQKMAHLQTITHRELQSKEPALMSQCWALKSLDMPQLHRSTQPSFSPVLVIIVTQQEHRVFFHRLLLYSVHRICTVLNEWTIQCLGFSLLFHRQPQAPAYCMLLKACSKDRAIQLFMAFLKCSALQETTAL